MAVEARHLNYLLHPQLVCNNRQLMNGIDENLNMHGSTSIGYGGLLLPPLSGMTTQTFLPPPLTHCSTTGVTHTLPLSRKRSRDSILGEDILRMIQYQQLDIDKFIALHMEKIRSEIEEHQKPNRRRIIAAVEDIMVDKLRAKEEEVDKIVKLNWALHEKVKSISIENKMWRDLAQLNEATVKTLRINLEQIMRHRARGADDAESCCSSNNGEEEDNGVSNAGSWCRKCGKEESCVLLLPCRHLCVCTVCGLGLKICPVCKTTKNASLVVNMC